MKFKKLASLLVVAAMMFAMAVPAFANNWGGSGTTTAPTTAPTAEPTEAPAADPTAEPTAEPTPDNSATSRSVAFKGTTKAPTINVDVATTMDIILNPYKLQVTQGSDTITDQLISSTLVMTNRSDCDIDVAGAITATVAGDVKLIKDHTKITTGAATDKAGDKNVVLGMAIGEVDGADAVISYASGNTRIITSDPVSPATTPVKTTKSSFTGFKSGGQSGWYLFDAAGTAKNFGDTKDNNTGYDATAATSGTPYQLKAGNSDATYLGFRLFGDASVLVTSPWTASDTISVNMALTITPQVRTAT